MKAILLYRKDTPLYLPRPADGLFPSGARFEGRWRAPNWQFGVISFRWAEVNFNDQLLLRCGLVQE